MKPEARAGRSWLCAAVVCLASSHLAGAPAGPGETSSQASWRAVGRNVDAASLASARAERPLKDPRMRGSRIAKLLQVPPDQGVGDPPYGTPVEQPQNPRAETLQERLDRQRREAAAAAAGLPPAIPQPNAGAGLAASIANAANVARAAAGGDMRGVNPTTTKPRTKIISVTPRPRTTTLEPPLPHYGDGSDLCNETLCGGPPTTTWINGKDPGNGFAEAVASTTPIPKLIPYEAALKLDMSIAVSQARAAVATSATSPSVESGFAVQDAHAAMANAQTVFDKVTNSRQETLDTLGSLKSYRQKMLDSAEAHDKELWRMPGMPLIGVTLPPVPGVAVAYTYDPKRRVR
eukprot:gnl/TRDRNA2_/TRDRNA2_191814_c0_seq1.p1 gnl/TRDRNA2_/TRDRNA2_191814_c0~~gnl/TRDRNA2_/TRDRNA2_191814_c0_seq1.p1  ORF type:complete len:384 (-),score=37.68 gnl/TRDRNA2_/TRDRNA2_191814_c0_seq1:97-1140(-)